MPEACQKTRKYFAIFHEHQYRMSVDLPWHISSEKIFVPTSILAVFLQLVFLERDDVSICKSQNSFAPIMNICERMSRSKNEPNSRWTRSRYGVTQCAWMTTQFWSHKKGLFGLIMPKIEPLASCSSTFKYFLKARSILSASYLTISILVIRVYPHSKLHCPWFHTDME